MLLTEQSSPSSSSSSSSSNRMDLTVLDRQRDVLLRLYPNDSWHHSDLHSVVDHHHHHNQLQSQFTQHDRQCNSNASPNPKKRKAELDVEGEVKDEGVVDGDETGEEKSEITTKAERGISSNTSSKDDGKKLDYIHVRARRGQATDSHSLAERARREKISKKMKCLQDLVPGCNKVTGKAGMLDEIINYVQSLQKQVEFLSMKLATVNPRVEFSANNIFAKEMPSYLAGLPAPPDSTCLPYNTIQQGTSTDMAIDQSQKPGLIPEVFLDPSLISQLQQLSGWESDWPNLLFN